MKAILYIVLGSLFKILVLFCFRIILNCEPSAYPPPKFRWFRELDSKGNGIFIEFPEKDFIVYGNSTGSSFSLKANSSVFGEKFLCKAENSYGKGVISYVIRKIVAPLRPDSVSRLIVKFSFKLVIKSFLNIGGKTL